MNLVPIAATPEAAVYWTQLALTNHVGPSSSFLGSTAQLRPWPPPQNPAEFLGGFSTSFFFTG
jgi:hypothetical protein